VKECSPRISVHVAPNLICPIQFSLFNGGGTLAKQPEDFHSLETALFRAREIGEELGEVVVLYFINMAIAEAKMKSPPTANDHKPRIRKRSLASRKKADITFRIWSTFIV
jgi:hypothetical protein